MWRVQHGAVSISTRRRLSTRRRAVTGLPVQVAVHSLARRPAVDSMSPEEGWRTEDETFPRNTNSGPGGPVHRFDRGPAAPAGDTRTGSAWRGGTDAPTGARHGERARHGDRARRHDGGARRAPRRCLVAVGDQAAGAVGDHAAGAVGDHAAAAVGRRGAGCSHPAGCAGAPRFCAGSARSAGATSFDRWSRRRAGHHRKCHDRGGLLVRSGAAGVLRQPDVDLRDRGDGDRRGHRRLRRLHDRRPASPRPRPRHRHVRAGVRAIGAVVAGARRGQRSLVARGCRHRWRRP